GHLHLPTPDLDRSAAVLRERAHVPDLQRPPDRRSRQASRGSQPDARDGRGHPRAAQPRRPVPRPVLQLPRRPPLPLRFRDVGPQRRAGPPPDLRGTAEHADARPGRRLRVVRLRRRDRHDLRRAPRHDHRSGGDDDGPGRDLRARVLARPRRPLPLLERPGGPRPLPGGRHLRRRRRHLHEHLLTLPPVARPRRGVRGDLRPAAALEPPGSHERGLHPHGPREGSQGAPGHLPSRPALGDHADHHGARPGHRHPDGRRDPDGIRLRDSRHRTPVLRRDQPQRHRHRPGYDALPRARRLSDEPAGRRPLRVPRPSREVL
ncbi:MAG: ABC transporter, permease protein 1 (cluster 5, nickel/peptides/opines), partial [uncultured Solirubrobacteraceae bacterium]